jgi:iron complex outermembrane receptor protein
MHRSTKNVLLASCALVGATALQAPAYSQDTSVAATPTAAAAPAAVAANAQSESSLNDIVVTARRREENVQHVPVAITAFSQATLEKKGISDAFSLNKAVPGLQVNADSGNSTLPSFSIRGRGQFFGAASGSVETYFADVPLSAPYQIPTLPPQFFDLQSVQVLKGPQGTLFGRNTTGGAVLFVPAAATLDKAGGYARMQFGNYNDMQFESAVNVPMGDIAALRVAAFHWFRKGYSKSIPFATTCTPNPADPTNPFDCIRGPDVKVNDPSGRALPVQRYDNQDVTEARATLLLKPTDSFTNSTIFTYHTDQNRSAQRLIGVNTGQPTFDGVEAYQSYLDFATSSLRTTRNNVDLRRGATSTFAIVNTSAFDLSDNLTIKNIFGYINSSGYGNNPGTADGFPAAAVDLPAPARQLHNHQTTDELQLQGNLFDNRLTYVGGAMIDLTRQPGSNDKINIDTNSFPDSTGTLYDEQFRQSRFTSKSVFGSATFKVTDTFSLSGGIRRTWDNIRERSCEYNTFPTASDATACADTVGFVTGAKKFAGWSYNGGVEWHPDDKTMLYGGYRRGYKRGGFNAKGTGLSLFSPETVDDFYAGVKKDVRLGDIRGHVNVEGFWDNYKNAQRSYLAFDLSVGALSTVVQNAPKQTYRGFDMDFDLDVTRWLELSGSYTFIDAFYKKFPDNTCNVQGTTIGMAPGIYCFNILGVPGGGSFVPVAAIEAINPGDQSDNPVGLVSKHKLSFTARFHTEIGSAGEIAFAPTFSYQSRFYINDQAFRQPNAGAAIFGPVNSAAHGANLAPGYKTVDLRVEWNHIMGSNFDLAGNVTNLTNKTFITGGSGIYQLGFNNVTFGAPRMFTVEAKVHF